MKARLLAPLCAQFTNFMLLRRYGGTALDVRSDARQRKMHRTPISHRFLSVQEPALCAEFWLKQMVFSV